VTVFLMGDGVTVAMAGQQTPDGYYRLDRMLAPVVRTVADPLLRNLHGRPRYQVGNADRRCAALD